MKCVRKFGMLHNHNVLQLRTKFQGEESHISMVILLLKLTMYMYTLPKTDLGKSCYRTALVLKLFHHEMIDEIWYAA